MANQVGTVAELDAHPLADNLCHSRTDAIIDQMTELLFRISQRQSGARQLAARLVRLSFDLESQIVEGENGRRAVNYIVGRLASGVSLRQTSREQGWSINKLRRFCDTEGISRPSRSVKNFPDNQTN